MRSHHLRAGIRSPARNLFLTGDLKTMAVTIKNGITSQAKLIYSNRLGNLVEITGGDLVDKVAFFDMTEEAKTLLEKASTAQEIENAIISLYGGKKGRRK